MIFTVLALHVEINFKGEEFRFLVLVRFGVEHHKSVDTVDRIIVKIAEKCSEHFDCLLVE